MAGVALTRRQRGQSAANQTATQTSAGPGMGQRGQLARIAPARRDQLGADRASWRIRSNPPRAARAQPPSHSAGHRHWKRDNTEHSRAAACDSSRSKSTFPLHYLEAAPSWVAVGRSTSNKRTTRLAFDCKVTSDSRHRQNPSTFNWVWPRALSSQRLLPPAPNLRGCEDSIAQSVHSAPSWRR